MSTFIQSQRITTLPRPVWLDKAGLSKGINHDRQHLGIILASDKILRIRQTNAAFTDTISLRLLNDDKNTEVSAVVGSSWTDVKATAVSVPFINTPYGSVRPVIEYEFPKGSKILPVYHEGDNDEESFFAVWDSQNAEFALIQTYYVNILVPARNKADLKKMPGSKSIEGLATFYRSLFTFYNEMAGVSFNPQRPTDLNSRNRYFLKADKHGAGAAYYGDNWSAESTSSVSSFWLRPEATSWGCLHEIAHGYEGHFMEDKHFSVGEVWNNIYGACYQNVMLGDRKFKEGWLYDYGHQARVETTINEYIDQGKAVNSWGLREKLYFLILMIEQAGHNTFTHFNQQYRLMSNTDGFVGRKLGLLDMLSDSFASSGRQIDVTAFVRLVGGYISPTQAQRNLYGPAKAVYPLNRFLEGETLAKAQQQLKLDSPVCLVTVEQMLMTGQRGDVTFEFEIDHFSQIYGGDICFLEGARNHKMTLLTPKMNIPGGAPIGVYKVHLPTGRDIKYERKFEYMIVKPGSNTIPIKYARKTTSSIVSQEINLLGLGDSEFCSVIIDQADRVIKVEVTTTSPHAYFPDQTYAEVVIKDTGGKELYKVTIPGTHATISQRELKFEPGYQLHIFHKEPSRVRLSPSFDGVIDSKATSNNFDITASGLKNKSLKNDPFLGLLARIDTAATTLRGYYAMMQAESMAKVDICLAIDLFPSPQREDLRKKYADCLPANRDPPGEGLGNSFTFGFNGISDHRFLTVEMDIVTRKMSVSLAAGVAHHYFSDTYASFRYVDANGREQLNLDIKGVENQKEQKWTFRMSGEGGEVIHIRHEEAPSRLLIQNNMQNIRLSRRDVRQNYRLTEISLDHMAG
ncbi:hypothetical protein LOZ12_001284 [Ophidiomyces ophidiicola]|nr:hypothetical protein LOZ62_003600 [Ophidiomyces ophidiicola]KAI2001475.1 hypothetical protein LOZ50_005647 [Ophidiomyces ophidiicola]KAI2023346.1 hypothetical protein LOZ45_004038 [Ophidiomyces ophidiicola]KAI2046458.1 hypothetical protein LOZ38_005377 [Ophidiomyces ophidiicola]KAI2070115.1 hypothetical protein LOZ37_005073 [Ophidiomyces ophidiicola]